MDHISGQKALLGMVRVDPLPLSILNQPGGADPNHKSCPILILVTSRDEHAFAHLLRSCFVGNKSHLLQREIFTKRQGLALSA